MDIKQNNILKPILSADDLYWTYFINLYKSAFPENERRTEIELSSIIGNKLFYPNVIINNDDFRGLFNYWKFDSFSYLEHFAIIDIYRGKGIGKQILNQFINDNIVVLECEPVSDEISQRRLEFYLKIGFNIFPFEYIQPPYSDCKSSMKLLLLTSLNCVSESSFNISREAIYKEVYKIVF